MVKSARPKDYPYGNSAPRNRKTLNIRFHDRHGFWPEEQACECGRPEKLHGPFGFSHEFVPTGRKALDP